jgi:hypothetical protein
MSGFRSGSTIGWLWMADDENGFPFPHVRVAVFQTGSLEKLLEHQIWSTTTAWQLPSVGVNEDGDLGVLLYAMGGGNFPKIQGFIRNDPLNWSGIQMNAIASSDSAPPDGDGDGDISFGHYGSVRPYGDCPETFLGSAYTVDQGVPQGRFVWFGGEGDGCPDLVTTKVTKKGAGPFVSGDTITVTATVKNQGSGLASASFIGYYLSRDADYDPGDISFNTTRAANALDPVEDHTLEATLPVPGVGAATGDFFIIACADDLERIDEIADLRATNCAATANPVSVRPKLTAQQVDDFALGPPTQVLASARPAAVRAGGSLTVKDTVTTVRGTRSPVVSGVNYVLSSSKVLDDDPIALVTRPVAPSRRTGTTLATTRRLTLPRRVPPGSWYLVGCLKHPRVRIDARQVNDCRTMSRAISVVGNPQTPGPVRSRAGQG